MRFNISIRAPKTKPVRILYDMYAMFLRGRVSRSAAALAYFLTISVFPMLICATYILGSLNITQDSLAYIWDSIIPEAALTVVGDFLEYVSGERSKVMLAVGIGAMFTSSSAAFRTIIGIIGDIQGKRRYTGVFGFVFGFVMSVMFLAVIYLSGVVIVTGGWFLQWLENFIGFAGITGAWQWVRFLLLFGAMFIVIYSIYVIAVPKSNSRIKKLPGALLASTLLVAVSTVFSRLISASTRYAVIYGSLASIIIMMIWLYSCGLIIIMGSVFNICFFRVIGHGD